MTIVWVGVEWSRLHRSWIAKAVFMSALKASQWVREGTQNLYDEPVDGERMTDRVELIE